jgi:hypothetical protein
MSQSERVVRVLIGDALRDALESSTKAEDDTASAHGSSSGPHTLLFVSEGRCLLERVVSVFDSAPKGARCAAVRAVVFDTGCALSVAMIAYALNGFRHAGCTLGAERADTLVRLLLVDDRALDANTDDDDGNNALD